LLAAVAVGVAVTHAGQPSGLQTGANGLRIALVKQPFIPTGTSVGPTTMADGGIQAELKTLGATVGVNEIGLTKEQEPEYGGWKRLSMALGHFADSLSGRTRRILQRGFARHLPSMPGWLRGCSNRPTSAPIRIGMLWLDAHPDFNTPEEVIARWHACRRGDWRYQTGLRLTPASTPLPTSVVMGGVRLIDPLEQTLLDKSRSSSSAWMICGRCRRR
jgi:arginase family enzyme